MTLKKFLGNMLSGSEDVSSKRTIAFIAFVCLVGGFCLDIFVGIKVNEFVWDSMLYIVLGGLGLTSIEKFKPSTFGGGDGGAAKKLISDDHEPITINDKTDAGKPVQEAGDDLTDPSDANSQN